MDTTPSEAQDKSTTSLGQRTNRSGMLRMALGAAAAAAGAGALLDARPDTAHAATQVGPTGFTNTKIGTQANPKWAVYAFDNTASSNNRAIWGYSPAGMGVEGQSNSNAGVMGYSGSYFGVVGHGDNAGVAAFNLHNDHAAYLASDFGAAWFTGNVHVGGQLDKLSGSFKIDHPLDPAHRYLSHSFVESPDMMNIYNGIARLDAQGEAMVALPDWFEALNENFRYQLTAIGAAGPNLHIAQEIHGGRFAIAGGASGMKVSWQITGIRHDAWAQAHRIVVEEDKVGDERGKYLYPEAHGLPDSQSMLIAPRHRDGPRSKD